MTISVKSDQSGTFGTLQINGTDKLSLNSGGSLEFLSTGARIKGDFSNATISNRVLFQSSVTNGNTGIGIIPNGTGSQSHISIFNGADPDNSSYAILLINSTTASVRSSLLGTGTYLPLAFWAGGAERLRIGTTGEIGLGGANYGTAGQVLTSGGTGAAPTWSTPSSGGSVTLADDTSTNTTYYPTFATATSGTATTIKVASTKLTYNPSTGVFYSTEFSSSSDEKLKENISTITNGLDVIKQLNPVEFNWKSGNGKGYGVIAQEIEKILPELVTSDGEYKSVKYDQIIAFLISAVKDLANKLDQ